MLLETYKQVRWVMFRFVLSWDQQAEITLVCSHRLLTRVARA